MWICLWWRWIRFVITDIKVKHNINNKIRIVQISDLQSKEFGKNNNVLYRKIIEQEPDIIVATGDLIDSIMKKLDEIIEFCSRVNKRVPMYYILGNNEMRCSRLNEIIEKLKANNIKMKAVCHLIYIILQTAFITY